MTKETMQVEKNEMQLIYHEQENANARENK
jgi:hypothetical protein